uniref:Uncharacterized protein n=1 Tax=Alexandrium andersonii TaxID=327968 RepID=A0A7S2DRP7_9DINO|mmetsp:Transcript_58560/g.131717  ORF Transcript_58560/g.131717 Transcript_58560/m.131717 type:complete len:246 (+) Transcript_58560:165-902(+)
MVCRLATQCCCGCSLSFGVKAILAVNLFRNVATLAVALLNVAFHTHTIVFASSLGAQTAIAAFCLAGIPIIVGGLWGIYNKAEAPLRLYWWYLVASLCLDMVFIVDSLILRNPCLHLGGLIARSGQAFACGAARGMNLFATGTMLGISFYLAFVVLSYCEDLANIGSGPSLADLSAYGEARMKKKLSAMDHIVGESTHCCVGEAYGSVIHQTALEGAETGSVPLFGNTYHQMQYPPPFEPYRRLE